MKFFSFLIAFAPLAAAFSPQQRMVQTSSQRHMLDPEMVHYLAQNCDQATSVQFVNCDDMSCELLLATRVGNNWEFESMGPADPSVWDQKSKIVKMAMDWTE